MSYRNVMYGILLTNEQLDFLKDDRLGFHRMTAFNTFVSMASIKPTNYHKTGFSTNLSIGQFAISIVELATLWKCDRKTAAKMVELFNQMGILSSERNNRTSVHTILCLAFWYIDGIKEAIKNPFYHRQSVTTVTHEKTVSNVSPNTPSFSENINNKDISQQKDCSATLTTIGIQHTNVPLSYNNTSHSVESNANKGELPVPFIIGEDFKQREEKVNPVFVEDGQPYRANDRQKHTEPLFTEQSSLIYDDKGNLTEFLSEVVQKTKHTETTDIDNEAGYAG